MFQGRKEKRYQASLTVETALVLPLFIFTVLILVYFINMVVIQEKINCYIGAVAREASQYAHVYDAMVSGNEDESKNPKAKKIVKGLISKESYHLLFESCADTEYLNKTWIKNGSNGVNFVLSKFMEDDETIDVVASYSIHIPYRVFGLNDIRCIQRVHTRGFVGLSGVDETGGSKEEEKKDDDYYVYITPTGTVYHKSKNCTHLKLNIRKITGEEIKGARNQGGAKYYPCEKCLSGVHSLEGGYFYIAKQGNKYHSSLTCPGLKRTIKAVKISQVGNRGPCSKCGK
ncbi:hypothetical protein lbkm_3260 [Lachnospiraceae bacterium KM106-2]|nr:hypothetical protein lbkm_3260 [Lachnospiraceae bacterium KM106-2]